MGAKRRWSRSADQDPLLTPAQFLALGAQPDGTVVRVQVDAAAGVDWKLRYNANSSSAAKWEVDGAAPALSAYQGGTNNVSTVNSGLVSSGATPAVSVPLTGDYEVYAQQTYLINAVAPAIIHGLSGAGLAGNVSTDPEGSIATANQTVTIPYKKKATLTAGGSITQVHYQNSGATVTVGLFARYIEIRPVRVVGP